MFAILGRPRGRHPAAIAVALRAVPRLRIAVRTFHLWLGLSLGLLFALLGLTGSALVFYVAIDEALNPLPAAQHEAAPPGWTSPVWDEALRTGARRWPAAGGRFSFEVTGEAGPIPARYYPPSDAGHHHAERLMVWFSPDGTRILRAEPWGGYAMSWIYDLHMALLAGEIGGQVVGWSGLAILVLLATGIVTWWPRDSWRKALAFKRGAVAQRRLRDLHKHSGLWSSVLLLLFAPTGALLALPTVKDALLAATIASPASVPQPVSGPAGGPPASLARALDAARPAVPAARLAFIDAPVSGTEPIRLRVQVPGDPHRRFPASYVFVDRFSAAVLAVHDERRGGRASAVSRWIRPIHDGSIGGMPTRILAFLAGLFPLALFVTGLLHWRKRRIARRRPTPIH